MRPNMNFALWRKGNNIPLQLMRLAMPQTIIIVKHRTVGEASSTPLPPFILSSFPFLQFRVIWVADLILEVLVYFWNNDRWLILSPFCQLKWRLFAGRFCHLERYLIKLTLASGVEVAKDKPIGCLCKQLIMTHSYVLLPGDLYQL